MPSRYPRWLFGLVLALTLFGPVPLAAVTAQTPEAGTPQAGTPTIPAGRGIDLDNMDLSVDPTEDFYRFANGGWLDSVELEADQASYGVFDELADLTNEQLLGVLSDLAADESVIAGTDEWTVARVYEQGLDKEARDAAGIDPVRPILNEIAGIETVEDAGAFQHTVSLYNLGGLLSLYVGQNPFDSSEYIVYANSPYLGLGDPGYYTEDESLEPIQAAYRQSVAGMLVITGMDEAEASAMAEEVYTFEATIAGQLYTPEESQNQADVLEELTVEEMAEAVPFIDWDSFLTGLGLNEVDRLTVYEGRQLRELDTLVRETDVAVLRAFMASEVMFAYAPFLDATTYEVYFDLFGRTLSGVESPTPNEERVTNNLSAVYGDVVGERYVAEYFPPEAKEQIEALVDDVIAAFRVRLENNPWISDEAREEALAKLDAIVVKVGYPDQFRTYENYGIGRNYGESMVAAEYAFYRENFALYGTEVDRTQWFATAQTVNAYYGGANNEIVFPAAILQTPFFDYEADLAVNYGAIGMVIGHEITHAFDRNGSQRDRNGNLNSWYTDEDAEAFDELNQGVIDQYSAIEVAPDLFVNGDQTVTENTADLGGMQTAWDALQIALEENGDPGEIDGFTQSERFFIAQATVWREVERPESLERQVLTGVHAPGVVRGVQPSRNMDKFFETFDISEGDAMWLPEDERITVW
ncbi:MAG TPA: M13 family metallopeptidase [Thermomicrobiales bacterium]|jgi:predicted metalloendopeptidase|nr:M13 family metallopeptidase [Thermomicrobiales bacterium]